MNRLEEYAGIFDGVEPFRGEVPGGYVVDYMGVLTDARFQGVWGDVSAARHVTTALPSPPDGGENGEDWIEQVNWFAAALRHGTIS